MILNLLCAACALTLAGGTLQYEGEQDTEQVPEQSQVEEVVSSQATEEGVVAKAEQVAEDILSKWFTPDKVAMIISWVTYAGTIVVLAIKLRNAMKQRDLTLASVKQAIMESLDGKVSESVSKAIEGYLLKAEQTEKQTQAVLSDFSKILALSQEDSPEARLAILEIIERLGNAPKEIVEQVKGSIEEDKKSQKELKKAIKEIATEKPEWDGTKI